ncbi:hypothetical protein FQA47_022334 [Oryzias melastigma]|uniref:Uncharacterized protein n=1 Tax=Oryzias melastigma TaxID=30732 RepID=A0A834BV13_ORYME|nr:hypothetical protein FQA47_022334 [Oryzias melastigma]
MFLVVLSCCTVHQRNEKRRYRRPPASRCSTATDITEAPRSPDHDQPPRSQGCYQNSQHKPRRQQRIRPCHACIFSTAKASAARGRHHFRLKQTSWKTNFYVDDVVSDCVPAPFSFLKKTKKQKETD